MVKTEEKIALKAEERKVFGHKNKKLRREGKLPGNIFGRDFKSTAVVVDLREFEKVYKKAGRTNVVYLKLGSKELPVLISNIQYDPVHVRMIHVDFRKVDLKKKVTAEVNVKVVGESPAVKDKGAEVLIQANTLEVEALPDKMPSEIQVDISGVEEPGVEIKVKDLPKSKDYQIVEDPEKAVVVIASHTAEEVETPETEAETAEQEQQQEQPEKKEPAEESKESESKES